VLSRNHPSVWRILPVVLLCCQVDADCLGAEAPNIQPRDLARRILDDTGVRGGLIVHVGCGDGRLTAALRASDRYLVQGLDSSTANVQQAREHIESLGIQGKVSVAAFDGRRLPHADNLVNLLVVEQPGDVSADEMMRVLVPLGVAYIKKGDSWSKTTKPWPEEIDEWTHWLHGPDGNAVAEDTVVGPPRRLQWIAKPYWSRHHHTVPSVSGMVSAAGRVFYVVDEAPGGMDGSVPDQSMVVGRPRCVQRSTLVAYTDARLGVEGLERRLAGSFHDPHAHRAAVGRRRRSGVRNARVQRAADRVGRGDRRDTPNLRGHAVYR